MIRDNFKFISQVLGIMQMTKFKYIKTMYITIFLLLFLVNGTVYAISNQEKTELIFDKLEALLPDFFPSTSTIAGKDYYRWYDSTLLGPVALYTKDEDLGYQYKNKWHYFSTLDEANELFCENKRYRR